MGIALSLTLLAMTGEDMMVRGGIASSLTLLAMTGEDMMKSEERMCQ